MGNACSGHISQMMMSDWNYRNVLLDIGVPGLMALGTGLLTYALTGGEEEYPENELVESTAGAYSGVGSQPQNDVDPSTVMNDPDRSQDLALESALQEFTAHLSDLRQTTTESHRLIQEMHEGNQVPPWARPLFETLQTLSSDIHAIKNSTPSSDPLPVPQEASTIKAYDINTLKRGIDTALYGLAHSLDDHIEIELYDHLPLQSSYHTNNALKSTCDMLLMYLRNLVKHPDLPRYRRIATNNSNYKTILMNSPGFKRFLQAMGFVNSEGSWVFEWFDDEKILSKAHAQELLVYGVEGLKALKDGTYTIPTNVEDDCDTQDVVTKPVVASTAEVSVESSSLATLSSPAQELFQASRSGETIPLPKSSSSVSLETLNEKNKDDTASGKAIGVTYTTPTRSKTGAGHQGISVAGTTPPLSFSEVSAVSKACAS